MTKEFYIFLDRASMFIVAPKDRKTHTKQGSDILYPTMAWMQRDRLYALQTNFTRYPPNLIQNVEIDPFLLHIVATVAEFMKI